ncbi:hypothetical protein CDD82_4380 [Ophiocordyceps australis]|uniref:Nephrocystin 3-like N-terminal domain-containing protein n=1 Tax=Ophiocordyceps australis TaxID=1399860 RepID=A0A2C5YC10_9HYPO|nr:hypothetical protein CDD82_4380 [Ophiocordyceps australis]
MEAVHSKNWLRKVHTTVWYCDFDHDPPELFETESLWRKHMQNLESHPKRKLTPPTEAQLAALSPRKQQAALREDYACPLCEQIPEKLQPLTGKQQSTEMYDLVVDHVANHLKSLSLLAVPSLESCTLQEPCTFGESVNVRDSFKRLMNENSVAQAPSGIEHLEQASLPLETWPNSDSDNNTSSATSGPTSAWDKEYLDYIAPEKPPEPPEQECWQNWNSWKHDTDPLFGQPLQTDPILASFKYAQLSASHLADTDETLESYWSSLYFPEMDDRFNGISAGAEGTCEWLFHHDVYNRWATSNRALLCIKGKTGSGKSTLLRHVVEHLEVKQNTRESPLILSFFFDEHGTHLQNTMLGLFRSLLYQLRQVPHALPGLVNIGSSDKKRHWDLGELRDLLQTSLLKALETQHIWLFVDAVDGCIQDDVMNLYHELRFLVEHISKPLKEFRFCLTSCFPDLHYLKVAHQCFDERFEINIEDENAADITTFVRRQLSRLQVWWPPSLAGRLTECSSGSFLWAELAVCQAFQHQGASLYNVVNYTRSAFEGFEFLCSNRFKIKYFDSRNLFQWIFFAVRPLSLDELRCAILFEDESQDLHECENVEDFPLGDSGMVEKVETLGRGHASVSNVKSIRFIHRSICDLFIQNFTMEQTGTDAPQTDFEGRAHFQLSRTCIRYMAMEEIAQSTMYGMHRLKDTFPLLQYATTCWPIHAKRSQDRSISQHDILQYFAWSSEALVLLWVNLYQAIEPSSPECPPKGTSMLHIVSRYGLIAPLENLLRMASKTETWINQTDTDGRTALSYAAENRHEAILKLLLERGADTEVKSSYPHRTPLSYAAENGHEAILKLLLERGADTEAKSLYVRQTPLSFAALNGHGGSVKLLLDKGADIEAKDVGGQTPLLLAVARGQEAIVKYLLEQGADAKAKDGSNYTPLSVATLHGSADIVELLLNKGADIEAKDISGQTPLLLAVSRGQEAIVKYLLEQGADAKAKDRSNKTPLSLAIYRGYADIVELLLERGVDIEVKDSYSQTPLLSAVQLGYYTIIMQLLNKGADIEATDHSGQTPLILAVTGGQEAIIKHLLEQGADIEAKDNSRRTPLLLAVAGGQEAIVKHLLEQGADIEAKDDSGRTPLLIAVYQGHYTLMMQLLNKGADIKAKDKCGTTLLTSAAGWGHEAIVKYLLEQGADAKAKDRDGHSPLWWATYMEHDAIIQLLASHLA